MNVLRKIQYAFETVKFYGGSFQYSLQALSQSRQKWIPLVYARFASLNKLLQSRRTYHFWIKKYETLFVPKLLLLDTLVDRLESRPTVSLILTITGSNDRQLIDCIDSISAQSYPHWELWIAGDSLAGEVKDFSCRLAAIDSRIRINSTLGGSYEDIANGVLQKVEGGYVVYLDGTGKLNRDALYWVVHEICVSRDPHIVYCDEDKIDNENQRFAPHFKPDWNPDLFLAWDYTGAFKVFSVVLARELGGFRAGFGNSQQYDLALRAIEVLKPDSIRHIPRILYHRHVHSQGSHRDEAVSCEHFQSTGHAVRDHLKRIGISAVVSEAPEMPACYRVSYALPLPLPKITLVIPTRNKVELLRRCIDSIRGKTDYSNYDIIVVDNGSDEMLTLNYLESLRGHGTLQVIRDEGTFNFSRLNNLAVNRASGELIGLLNNDLEVMNGDWLSEMASHAMRPEIGIVGARLWYPDDTIQHAGVILANGIPRHVHKGLARGCKGYFGRAVLTQNLVAVTAACMVLRKKIYIDAGRLDEAFAVAFNDIDLCLRIRSLGYRNLWTPYAELYHHESASRGLEDTAGKISRYFQELALLRERWGDEMFVDPYYNPNLDSRSKDFSLAWPPIYIDRSAG